VAVGSVVGQVAEGARAAPEPKKPAEAAKAAKTPASAAATEEAPPAAEREAPMSPAARRLVEDEKVDVGRVTGSGRGGLITKEDVVNFLDRQKAQAPAKPQPAPAPSAKPPTAPAPQAAETRQRMSAIRQRIAERLVASQQSTATLTTFNEADLSAVLALRARFKDKFKE